MPSRWASKSAATEAAQSIKAPAGRSTGRKTEISFNMLDRFLVGRALNSPNYALPSRETFDLSHAGAAPVGCRWARTQGKPVMPRVAAAGEPGGYFVRHPIGGCGQSCRFIRRMAFVQCVREVEGQPAETNL